MEHSYRHGYQNRSKSTFFFRMHSRNGFAMWIYPYFGTYDYKSAPLIKYDLQNDDLEVKKANSAVEIPSCGLYQLISKKNYFCGLSKVRTWVPVAYFSFF